MLTLVMFVLSMLMVPMGQSRAMPGHTDHPAGHQAASMGEDECPHSHVHAKAAATDESSIAPRGESKSPSSGHSQQSCCDLACHTAMIIETFSCDPVFEPVASAEWIALSLATREPQKFERPPRVFPLG